MFADEIQVEMYSLQKSKPVDYIFKIDKDK